MQQKNHVLLPDHCVAGADAVGVAKGPDTPQAHAESPFAKPAAQVATDTSSAATSGSASKASTTFDIHSKQVCLPPPPPFRGIVRAACLCAEAALLSSIETFCLRSRNGMATSFYVHSEQVICPPPLAAAAVAAAAASNIEH